VKGRPLAHLRRQRSRAELIDTVGIRGKQILDAVERHVETVVHSEFTEELVQVDLHGAFGDPHGGGDFLVLEALRP